MPKRAAEGKRAVVVVSGGGVRVAEILMLNEGTVPLVVPGELVVELFEPGAEGNEMRGWTEVAVK